MKYLARRTAGDVLRLKRLEEMSTNQLSVGRPTSGETSSIVLLSSLL